MTELFDSSVWIEFIRDTGSPACDYLSDRLRNSPNTVAITEPVLMEVLAGPTRDPALRAVERLLAAVQVIGIAPNVDFLAAAQLFRSGRITGRTVRSLHDCVIAAVAIRAKVTLVHRDADFEVIASISELQTRSFVDA